MSGRGPWRSLGRALIVSGALGVCALVAATGVGAQQAPVGRAAATASPAGLQVVPFPGTPDVAPSSAVIFSTLRHTQIRWVRVVGSHSGPHAGHLSRLATGQGTEFIPDTAFTPGETVSVSVALRSPAAAGAAGDPAARQIRFSFGVAVAAPAALSASGGPQARTAVHPPTQGFRTEPGFRPPVLQVSSDGDPRAGDIFLTTNNMPQVGPMIINGRGQLLWYDPFDHGEPAYNFRVQYYERKPVLTFWQGKVVHGHAVAGHDVILNPSYQVVKFLRAAHGYASDLHEFQLTPQGTALIDSFVPVRANLTSVGGSSRGTMLDGVIQELDIKTGRLVWEWHMLGHIPVSDTYLGPPGGPAYDPYHLNSIQQLPNGNLVISARNTWAVYEIDKRTGRVMWELGGKHPSFHMGRYTNFEWQHDARLHHDVVSVFDDGALPQVEPSSVAKEISINTNTMTATMIRSIRHKPPVLAGSLGNVQKLRDGNLFVGWGSADNFSEYTPKGKQIFNGALPLGVNSYRAFRMPWVGQPISQPLIAVTSGSGGTLVVYASWNGATQVARWQVIGGVSPRFLLPLSSSPWEGFETRISVRPRTPYVAVRAIGPSGHILGTSQVRATGH